MEFFFLSSHEVLIIIHENNGNKHLNWTASLAICLRSQITQDLRNNLVSAILYGLPAIPLLVDLILKQKKKQNKKSMFVKMIRICQVILNYKRLSDGHHFNNVHQSLTCICHYINTICTSTNFKKGRKNKIPHLVLTHLCTHFSTHTY